MFSSSAVCTYVEVEGVRFSRSIDVATKKFNLQGFGLLRYMIFIKAYAGALYLTEAGDAENVLGPIAKRLELEYFHAIKAEDFASATLKKISENVTAEELIRLRPRIAKLNAIYQNVNPGDRYALTYIPGKGTTLTLNGTFLGMIRGDDFAAALYAIWLGKNPIDRKFRDLLLGKFS
jgi:hypothetical protein